MTTRWSTSTDTMGLLDKIKDLEAEIARTQKNKATEKHLGSLRAKLAKARAEMMEGPKSSGKGEGFDVAKAGDARVSMVGFPSVGKSTLLSKVTDTESTSGAYEFTTLTCIPGVIEYMGANIQLLDLPGIIEGAAKGKGRGRQVIGVARTSDLILMMMDASKGEIQRKLLEAELESVGIRLNEQPPDITFKVKKGGGIQFNSTVPLTKIDENVVKSILSTYKIHHAEVLFREDATMQQFIDVIQGNRRYIRCLYVYNKMDTVWMEEVERLANQPDTIVISCAWDINLDWLIESIWDYLDLTRVYTKKRSAMPDFDEPFILRDGTDVESVCRSIHNDMVNTFKYATVWGRSSKFNPNPQRVGLKHVLADEDVLQIVAATIDG
ncbi:developmentally-regulated GTP-binding protein 2 [Thecamonas trahens ATCC 50062]|uniref:Developmentally-regulated GTP-binding protein 2 n=1 Tax=Thecamonas trahens ATCC 50062 TaxID=461836 RepID=A0A0L0DS08_THETB|nr:developmentally-regulated GTP-binding protein 2 [Thecamonas trahens ATCC 50062]KNC55032.1 developmentally-regulated GTP-binding protein 2 [Thecamonas trahens ATCC 50062]|eukprot:XP_013753338.1 developmentally-regulated GTP-binding protein 2 [Thecamonas trahens ATCC 50062]